jgi:hypothetical protein
VRINVVGTAVFTLYVLARQRRSSDPLTRGLPALGRFIREAAMMRLHLVRFALSHPLDDDARAWGVPPDDWGMVRFV